ncbi:hypothetical protein AAVH_22400, partial [Aphelenchoides avenae]
FTVTCARKASLCIVPEKGNPWVPAGKTPPDAIELYPYCEANLVTDLKTGWLGSVLSQSGRAQLKEAQYYYVPNPKTGAYATKPRGYNSVFIKAVAVSCAGCNNVQKYATFTCHMPLANG